MLNERGIDLDPRAPAVVLVPGIDKTADFSFRVRGVRWVIEVKSGLEFNSLGAALLEGVLFRRREPGCCFVLLSLYSKMRASPERVSELLVELSLEHAFDHIAVFSLNSDRDGVWCPNMAARINEFFRLVPTPEVGGE